jgi:hypothetical protein
MTAASAASHDLVWRQFMINLGFWNPKNRAVFICDNDEVVGISNGRVGLTYRNR